jgi:mannose-6-phosphate isomerase-like protein (cupin superfamily)
MGCDSFLREDGAVERVGSTLIVSRCDEVAPFTTKDGSTIREILAPAVAPGVIRNQSLAEATLPPGTATEAHFHPVTEEIYYILRGSGRMQIGDQARAVGPGDAVAIPPGAAHRIRNVGADDLIFLCCCAPAYTHDDTVFADLAAL